LQLIALKDLFPKRPINQSIIYLHQTTWVHSNIKKQHLTHKNTNTGTNIN